MESSYQGGVAYEETENNYQRLSQTIASNIKKISQNVSSMSKMVNQLQTPQDSQELRNQLRQIQNYTQKLVKDTSSHIMELMKLPTDKPAQKLSRERLSDEYMITLNSFQMNPREEEAVPLLVGMEVMRTPQGSLVRRNDVLLERTDSGRIRTFCPATIEGGQGVEIIDSQQSQPFAPRRLFDEESEGEATQRLAAQKSKEEVKKQKALRVPSLDPFSMGSQSGNKELVELEEPNARQQEQLAMQTERSLIELEERERDIRSLENDIMDVNTIFKELGTMIHAQGEVVDSIESSVEYATQNVEAGTTQLREASNYKNKLRKKKVYLLIALIIIISIILIIVFRK